MPHWELEVGTEQGAGAAQLKELRSTGTAQAKSLGSTGTAQAGTATSPDRWYYPRSSTTSGTAQATAQKETLKLDVNVVSIVTGALVVLSLMAWINAIKVLCEHVMDDQRPDRYGRVVWRKFIAAAVMTLLSAFLILALYLWLKQK